MFFHSFTHRGVVHCAADWRDCEQLPTEPPKPLAQQRDQNSAGNRDRGRSRSRRGIFDAFFKGSANAVAGGRCPAPVVMPHSALEIATTGPLEHRAQQRGLNSMNYLVLVVTRPAASMDLVPQAV